MPVAGTYRNQGKARREADAPLPHAGTRTAPSPSPHRRLNVLIVDDDPREHSLYQEYLDEDTACSYRLLHAYTGAECEQLYKAGDIDCILLDYHLPDRNGLEVLKRLAEEHETVPAVMLTGEGNESVAVVAMKLGSQDYLPKRVVTGKALRRTVARAVERAEMMRQVEAYRRDLERSNQDLERFANILAHDLKSPLRAIAQHLELIRKDNQDRLDARSLKSMAFACEGAERMGALIDALFAFSKIGFSKKSIAPLDMERVLAAATENLSVAIQESGARITHDALPTVMADRMQLMQVFQNLLGNAMKYCKDRPEIHVSAEPKEDLWVFSVRDNGIGIPESNLQHIFAIFKRLHTEQEYPGMGVGLAICERVISSHGGRIWAESRPGEGATFYFTLPTKPPDGDV